MDLTLIAIQAIGVVAAVAAMWLMGNETLWGPTVSFLSGLPFIALYIRLGAYLAPVMTITLMCIDVRNFIKWRREGISWTTKSASTRTPASRA